jgi:uncharacterized MAPEG superfamily protein
MENFAAYGHAITAVVIYAMVAQVLNAMTGIAKGSNKMVPGASYVADYADKNYRLDRTYMNSVEMLVFTGALIFAAILAGASPFWTNIFASIALLLRLVMNVIYMRGIGDGYGGIRTMMAIGQSLCNLGLAVIAILAVFTT